MDKKILLITESLGSGGAERQLVGLAIMLKEKGYNVIVITWDDRFFYLPMLQDAKVAYKSLRKAENKYFRTFYFWNIIRKERPSHVITFLPGANMAICIAKFLFKGNWKLIVCERSFTKVIGIKEKLLFSLYRKANVIVTNSYAEAKNLSGLFPSLANKICTICNFVDTQCFSPAVLKPNNSLLTILCVGRVVAYKNVLRFMEAVYEALKINPKFRVVWIGDCYIKQFKKEVDELYDRLNLGEHFLFKPQTNTIADEYKKADIFCLPSLFEGYPNVIIEAKSSALPVICSNICENPTIIKEGVNGGLFNPKDVNDIKNCILKIISKTPQELAAFGRNNREEVLRQNSKEVFVSRYIKLIENLI